MRGIRLIAVLTVATAIAIGVVFSVDHEPDTIARSGEFVFPTLLNQVNAVERVQIIRSEGPFTLIRRDNTWIIEEKERYPAEPNKIHRLLVGAAEMRRVEPKTSKPERYQKIRLEDPTDPNAQSVRFVLEDGEGVQLANWVLGDRRPSRADSDRTELFIRVGDDPQAWLVEGSVPDGRTIIDWLDRTVSRIEPERLRDIEVVHADGAMVEVSKSSPPDSDFTLHDIPEGHEIDTQYRINDIGRFFEEFQFEDVIPASGLDFSGPVDQRVRATTFDGLRITLEIVGRDEAAYARLRAEFDETLIDATPPEAKTDADGTADAESAVAASASALLTPADVQEEVERLNARWMDWAYELPSFKRDYLAKRVADLTKLPAEKDDS